MAKLSFNAKTATPMEERSFTLLPEGQYVFQITKTEMVRNKSNTADRLNMQAKIIKGKHKGEMAFIGLNWGHPNQTAQNISDQEFKSICDAVEKGDDEIEDSDELKGTEFVGTIVHSKPSGDYIENGETKFKYGPKAEIKKYEKANGHPVYENEEAVNESASDEPTKSAPPWGDKE